MVGLGDTTKTLGKLADTAERVFERLNDLREQVEEMHDRVDETHERVTALERDAEEQRALLEALAEKHDIDIEAVLTEAAIDEAEENESQSPTDDA